MSLSRHWKVDQVYTLFVVCTCSVYFPLWWDAPIYNLYCPEISLSRTWRSSCLIFYPCSWIVDVMTPWIVTIFCPGSFHLPIPLLLTILFFDYKRGRKTFYRSFRFQVWKIVTKLEEKKGVKGYEFSPVLLSNVTLKLLFQCQTYSMVVRKNLGYDILRTFKVRPFLTRRLDQRYRDGTFVERHWDTEVRKTLIS